VRIRILTGFSGADYSVSDVDGDIATEFAKSKAELRGVLKVMGMAPEAIEDTVGRLSRERLVEVMFEPRRR
jgi:hypothetical protein